MHKLELFFLFDICTNAHMYGTDYMDLFVDIIRGGLAEFLDYLAAHFITCLVPVFFIAGAIVIFVSQGSILKYFVPTKEVYDKHQGSGNWLCQMP